MQKKGATMSLATTDLPPLALERIQQQPIPRYSSDSVLPCPEIPAEVLDEVTRLFKECFDQDQFHFLPEKWESHRAAIKSCFQLIEGYVKPTFDRVPSLNDLVSETLAAKLPEGSPPGSPGKKPEPVPDQIVHNHRLAEILGYYKAMKMQIEDIEACTNKKINLNDILGELLRIFGIVDFEERVCEFLKLFETQFETISVQKDGNCFPRAVVRILQKLGHPTYGMWEKDDKVTEDKMASMLRNDFIDFLRANEKDFSYLMVNLPLNEKSYESLYPLEKFETIENESAETLEERKKQYEKYCIDYDKRRYQACINELANSGCFFQGEFIHSIAKMLKMEIQVYQPEVKNSVNVIDGRLVPYNECIFSEGPDSIHILKIGEHFWGLLPKVSHG